MIAPGTPSNSDFARLEYVTSPRSNHCELPAMSVSSRAISPPVQDSAVASHSPRLSSRSAIAGTSVESMTRQGSAELNGAELKRKKRKDAASVSLQTARHEIDLSATARL